MRSFGVVLNHAYRLLPATTTTTEDTTGSSSSSPDSRDRGLNNVVSQGSIDCDDGDADVDAGGASKVEEAAAPSPAATSAAVVTTVPARPSGGVVDHPQRQHRHSTFEAALVRFYEYFEDFLDDHKENAFNAVFQEPVSPSLHSARPPPTYGRTERFIIASTILMIGITIEMIMESAVAQCIQ